MANPLNTRYVKILDKIQALNAEEIGVTGLFTEMKKITDEIHSTDLTVTEKADLINELRYLKEQSIVTDGQHTYPTYEPIISYYDKVYKPNTKTSKELFYKEFGLNRLIQARKLALSFINNLDEEYIIKRTLDHCLSMLRESSDDVTLHQCDVLMNRLHEEDYIDFESKERFKRMFRR